MAVPARSPHAEHSVEERLARLEVVADHTRSNVHRLETKIDRLESKVDDVNRALGSRIDDVDKRLGTLTLTVEERFSALNVGRAMDRVWWLLMAGALLGVMARGFKWI